MRVTDAVVVLLLSSFFPCQIPKGHAVGLTCKCETKERGGGSEGSGPGVSWFSVATRMTASHDVQRKNTEEAGEPDGFLPVIVSNDARD